MEYWREVPPLHVIVASYTGALKKKPRKIEGIQMATEAGEYYSSDDAPPQRMDEFIPMAGALPGLATAKVEGGKWNGLIRGR